MSNARIIIRSPEESHKAFISQFLNAKVSIEDRDIENDIYFKQDNYKVDKLFFKDIHFNGQLFFDGCDIRDGIKFINCTFEKALVFHRCKTKKSDYDFLPGDKSIEFIDCKINLQIDVRFCKFEGGIIFNNCTIEDAYFEQFIVSIGGGIEFRNSTEVNKSIRIINCNLSNGGIRLNGSTFKGALRFENNTLGSYDFTFSNFIKNIFIWAGYCTSITFYKSQFEEDFTIQIVKVKDSVSIIECEFKKIFKIELDEKNGNKRGLINSIYLSQTDFLNVFSLKKFKTDKSSIKKIDLIFQNLNGSFHFDDISIEELHISGYNISSRVVLENVVLKKFDLEKFRNSGSIDFINVRPDGANSMISFKSSILGSFAFVNCQLDTYQQYEIHDSIFDQVISSGTKWFDFNQIARNLKPLNRNWLKLLQRYIKIKVFFFNVFKTRIDIEKTPKVLKIERQILVSIFKTINWISCLFFNIKMLFFNLLPDNGDIQKLYQIREIFRQLKVSMDKQGNRIQSLFFQSQEFNAYEKELRLSHRIWKPERLILWSNRSNSHGQDWLKPIFLGILFTGLWFIFMVISMNPNLGIHWPWNCNFLTTYKIYVEYFKGVPDLFNPTFRLDLVFATQTNEFTFSTYFWALIQRISISYFIFQTISAFRKYMK
ncbi:MAG: hypothetical protein JZU47_07755 [Prolixibacteraceae bacterium]|nr:hypothetical protein [Prolixibacteraceae bacterium]